jgi:hypothetical protein
MENKKGFDLILQERRRQIEVEGWTSDHDDNHESGEIGRAGACYETAALHDNPKISHTWPWATEWWKPKDGAEYAAWGESEHALDVALESGWETSENGQYCPECYYYNDEDELVFKTKTA